MRRILSFCVVLTIALLAAAAFAQTRNTIAPSGQQVRGGADGSGDGVQERAYDPRGNEARQPERSEGNEDDLDINEGDDGTGGGSASQGGHN